MHASDPQQQSFDCSDAKVLTALYGQLRPYALKKCQYMLGDIGTAQDVVQDVFMRLWRAPITFPSIAAAYKWVYKSCHNAAIDRMRSAKRHHAFIDQEWLLSPAHAVTPQDRVINRQMAEKVLHLFSEREAAVLMYTAVDRLSHREIAELMDVSVKTIQRTVVAIEETLATLRRGSHD